MDIMIIDQGSIVQLFPKSPAGVDFLNSLDAESWQWMGASLCVDHRCAEGLLDFAVESGLDLS